MQKGELLWSEEKIRSLKNRDKNELPYRNNVVNLTIHRYSGTAYRSRLRFPNFVLTKMRWLGLPPGLRECHVGIDILKSCLVAPFHVCQLGEE